MPIKLHSALSLFLLSIDFAFGQVSVEPTSPYAATRYSVDLVTYCLDAVTTKIIPDCTISLQNGFTPNEGGHVANNHGTRQPSAYGHLTSTGGSYTGSTGYHFIFLSSRVGGWEFVKATSPNAPPELFQIQVGYQDIYYYNGHPKGVLIGGTASHPLGNNHSGTLPFLSKFNQVVTQYDSEFSCVDRYSYIGINDMSLPLGGVFDVGADWAPPHASHDRGTAVDVKWKPYPQPNSIIDIPFIVNRFLEICLEKGLPFAIKENIGTDNQHIHCGISNTGF